jgi:hypothetical protein
MKHGHATMKREQYDDSHGVVGVILDTIAIRYYRILHRQRRFHISPIAPAISYRYGILDRDSERMRRFASTDTGLFAHPELL